MTGWLVTAAMLLVPAGAGDDDKSALDLRQMQGDWMVASMTVNGMKLAGDEAQVLFRTVEGERYTVSRYSKRVGQGVFKLDATASPKTIDSTLSLPANQKGPVLGIYRFDGQRLTICNALPGKPRPSDFESKPGSNHTLIVWERERA